MEVLRRWAADGNGQMDFLLTGGQPEIFDDEARALGARLYYLRYSRANIVGFTRAFRRILREERYDAIHDHSDYASGWHYLLGAGVLPPVRVTHVHNPIYQATHNYGVTLRRRATARAGRLLVAQFATHIDGTSKQAIVEHGFTGPRFAKIRTQALHCGFDPAPFGADRVAARAHICTEFGWPEDARIILFAGRIDRSPDPFDPQTHKNSGFAVSATIACAKRDPHVRAVFAGAPSPATPILESRIAEAGFAGRIVLAGVRHDIPDLMLAADVLLFPSRGEGLGMVAVEAQAAGLPVVASSAVPRECVVVPELVHFMSVEEGAERWAEILLQEMERPRNIEAPNRAVATSPFSIGRSVKALEEIYTSTKKK
jgi:glycosyltransferase involved in cell wall biosynthesis